MKYLLNVNIIFIDITETEKRSANCPQETFSEYVFPLLFFLIRTSIIFFSFQKEFSYENESAVYLSGETQSSHGTEFSSIFSGRHWPGLNSRSSPTCNSFLHKLWVILKSKFKTQFSVVVSFIT